MLKKNTLCFFFIIISLILFIGYTYFSIKLLGYGKMTGLSYDAYIKLAFVTMSIILIIFLRNKFYTNFSLLWIIWSLWLFVDFYILGFKGGGVSNIFHATFGPMTFILFYLISLWNNNTEKILFIGFIIIYMVSYIMIMENITIVLASKIGEETTITNLIYWCLCPMPLLLINRKRWFHMVVIICTIIIVLITGKRSANLVMIITTLIFLLNVVNYKNKSLKIQNIILIIVFIMSLYYIIEQYFGIVFFNIVERFYSIEEDQGSGRIPIYTDVFNAMKNNSFIEWIFGNGFGSILMTKHTNAHNDALQMLFEYGFIGILIYGMFIVYIIKRMHLLRQSKSHYYIGYATSVVITIILGLVSNLIVFYSYFAFLCAFWGFIEAQMVKAKLIKTIHIKQ